MPENIEFVEFCDKFKSFNVDHSDSEISVFSYGLIVDFDGEFPISFDSIKAVYLNEGISFMARLNGSWLIYIHDKRDNSK